MIKLQVLVAESSNARFFCSGTSAGSLQLDENLTSPAARLHERELVSSRPGRMVNASLGRGVSLGARHSARETALDQFARRIARRLAARSNTNPGDGIVLIASARLLGLISGHLSATIRHRVIATLAKDLFQISRTELQARVRLLLKTLESPPPTRVVAGRTTRAIRRR